MASHTYQSPWYNLILQPTGLKGHLPWSASGSQLNNYYS